MATLNELMDKNASYSRVADEAVRNPGLREELLAAVSPANDKLPLRSISEQALLIVADEHPDVLIDKWDFFFKLLSDENPSVVMSGLHVLPRLIRLDKDNKFDAVIDTYLKLITEGNVSIAAQAAGHAAKIIRAKAHLRSRVLETLLAIDSSNHSPVHNDLIKAYIVNTLSECYDLLPDHDRILEFVAAQKQSTSPKTRAAVMQFLQTHS